MTHRILFATTNYSYFTLPISQALESMGFQVKLFDYNKPNWSSRLVGLIDNLTHTKNLPNSINQALIHTANQFQPDYLLVIKGEVITPTTIRHLNSQGVITINWYPDWFDSWKWIIRHAPAYRFFINCCQETSRRLNQAGIKNYYLAYAAPLTKHRSKLKKIYPVTFVGQHTSRREKYFRAIQDLGLHILGHRWQNSSLHHLAHGPISVAATHKIIQQSHLVVNILNGSDRYQPTAINIRTFETTGLGTCLLVKSDTLLSRYFKPGKELVIFTTPQDLRRKILYYLDHDQEREKIALAGYNRVLKDHTFAKRLKQLFRIVTAASNGQLN